jgi:hypothetical protein
MATLEFAGKIGVPTVALGILGEQAAELTELVNPYLGAFGGGLLGLIAGIIWFQKTSKHGGH